MPYFRHFSSKSICLFVLSAVWAISAGAAGTPTTIAISSGNNQTGNASTALANSFVVLVKDSAGNPTSGTQIDWTILAGAKSLAYPSSLTVNGLATNKMTLGTAWSNTAKATIHGTNTSVTFTATSKTVALVATTIAINSGNTQGGTAGSPLPGSFIALVKDQNGNAMTGAQVDWAVATGGGSFSSASSTTSSAGLASNILTLGTTAGANTATATIHATSTSVTFAATSVAGAASTIAISSGNNQTGNAGSALAANFVVLVKDKYGNATTGTQIDWTILAGAKSLSAATSITSVGLATDKMTLGTAWSNTAKATIYGTSTSVTFTATAKAVALVPTTIAISAGNSQSGPAGSPLASGFVALVKDQNGNAMTSAQVDWSVATGGGSLSVSSSITSSGLASSTLILGKTAGANTAKATIHSTSTSVTFSATGTAIMASVTVQNQPGIVIPNNFMGVSLEWTATTSGSHGLSYTVGPSTDPNPVFVQLMKNLITTPSTKLLVRVGGGSTDQVGAPAASTPVPSYSATPDADVAALAQFSSTMGSSLELGLGANLAANSPTLVKELLQLYVSKIPAANLTALEIGNEPDNYVSQGLRAAPYPFVSPSPGETYMNDLNAAQTAIKPVLPSTVQLMGPASGDYGWPTSNLSLLLQITEQLSGEVLPTQIITEHAYPGGDGETNIAIDDLLQSLPATIVATAVAPSVTYAHQHGVKFRLGETSSLYDGGEVGVSDTFQSALWMVDYLFENASVGVDGVNIITSGTGGAGFDLFRFWNGSSGNWALNDSTRGTVKGLPVPTYPGITAGQVPEAEVRPSYYGMLMFQQATAGGAAIIPVSLVAGAVANTNLKAWATVMPDQSMNIVLINKDKAVSGTVTISLPANFETGTLTWLSAAPPSGVPAYLTTGASTGGGQVTFAGGTFEGSSDGTPVSVSSANEPVSAINTPTSTGYSLTLPATSAVIMHVAAIAK